MFYPSPERAVDAAIASGELAKLPFIKREAVAALKASHPDRQTAEREIAEHLTNFYRTAPANADGNGKPVSQQDLGRAILATQRLYSRNVFPRMNVTWGTYPNHIGHMDAPGCFRCHDDSHKTQDGKVIKQECDLCHKIE
jgi:hypothetical protein